MKQKQKQKQKTQGDQPMIDYYELFSSPILFFLQFRLSLVSEDHYHHRYRHRYDHHRTTYTT